MAQAPSSDGQDLTPAAGPKPRFNPRTRIFQNDFLESLTRTHPIGPILFWPPMAVLSMWYAVHHGTHAALAAGLFVLGVLLWTLYEYALHRWVMHWVPPTVWGRKLYYLAHQVHHDEAEFDRLVAPVAIALITAVPLLSILLPTAGPVRMWAVFSGVIVGYLAYDYIHLYTHFGKPTSRLGKLLRRHHMQHHALHNRWFGVSTPLWDYVFRTSVRPGERVRPCQAADVDWGRPAP